VLLCKVHGPSFEEEFAEYFKSFLLILAEEALIAFVVGRQTIIGSACVAVTMAMLQSVACMAFHLELSISIQPQLI
jgi:hypothetical protein